jgi:phosphoribosylformylglycinamidine synthase
LYGAKTGGDGIGGVSVLASETFGEGGSTKRPSVQVGDPFVEKVLIECSLEIFAEDLVVGIQDLGGAGLSCATSELGIRWFWRHAGRSWIKVPLARSFTVT